MEGLGIPYVSAGQRTEALKNVIQLFGETLILRLISIVEFSLAFQLP